jgi:hypothetical protein
MLSGLRLQLFKAQLKNLFEVLLKLIESRCLSMGEIGRAHV